MDKHTELGLFKLASNIT